jgi:acyl-CoA thioesterase YciA
VSQTAPASAGIDAASAGSASADAAPGDEEITFRTRKWVRPEDLNANGTLFGGSLLRWIDEEATIYAILQLGNHQVVTKYMSEIEFVASARQGDIIEMGLRATAFGRTSLTMRAEVRNMITRRSILTVDRIVFVGLGSDGRPKPHGYSTITFDRDRIPAEHAQLD